MIVVRAFLVPYGYMPEEQLGELKIWNDASGTREIGHYGVAAKTLPHDDTTRARLIEPVEEVFGEIRDFARQDRHVWHLVTEALNNVEWSVKGP